MTLTLYRLLVIYIALATHHGATVKQSANDITSPCSGPISSVGSGVSRNAMSSMEPTFGQHKRFISVPSDPPDNVNNGLHHIKLLFGITGGRVGRGRWTL